MPGEIVILLTGTINVNGKSFTTLIDPEARKKDYVETIDYHLKKYPYRVVFVENSDEDISGNFSKNENSQRLEILSFQGNNYNNELGKGLGEMKCIEYAINNSRIIKEDSFIFKITGRYRIQNFSKFIANYKEYPETELLADLTGNFTHSISSIFGFQPFFAKEYLFKYAGLLNDEKKFYFEHALAKAVCEAIAGGIKFQLFKHYPIIKAISGTTGKPYKKSFFYMLPRHLKYWLRFKIVNR